MVAEHTLLKKIEALLEATSIHPTQFGIDAVNDGKLITQLREGRELRRATRKRIEDHIKRVLIERTAALKAASVSISKIAAE